MSTSLLALLTLAPIAQAGAVTWTLEGVTLNYGSAYGTFEYTQGYGISAFDIYVVQNPGVTVPIGWETTQEWPSEVPVPYQFHFTDSDMWCQASTYGVGQVTGIKFSFLNYLGDPFMYQLTFSLPLGTDLASAGDINLPVGRYFIDLQPFGLGTLTFHNLAADSIIAGSISTVPLPSALLLLGSGLLRLANHRRRRLAAQT